MLLKHIQYIYKKFNKYENTWKISMYSGQPVSKEDINVYLTYPGYKNVLEMHVYLTIVKLRQLI